MKGRQRRRLPGRADAGRARLRLLVAGGRDTGPAPARGATPRPGCPGPTGAGRDTRLEALLEAGVRDGVFPAAQVSVFHEGREVGRAAVGAGTGHALRPRLPDQDPLHRDRVRRALGRGQGGPVHAGVPVDRREPAGEERGDARAISSPTARASRRGTRSSPSSCTPCPSSAASDCRRLHPAERAERGAGRRRPLAARRGTGRAHALQRHRLPARRRDAGRGRRRAARRRARAALGEARRRHPLPSALDPGARRARPVRRGSWDGLPPTGCAAPATAGAGTGEPLGVAPQRPVAPRRGGRRQRLGDGRRLRPRRPLRHRHRGRAVRPARPRGARRGRAPGPGRAVGTGGHPRAGQRPWLRLRHAVRRVQLRRASHRTDASGRLRAPGLHRDQPLGGQGDAGSALRCSPTGPRSGARTSRSRSFVPRFTTRCLQMLGLG